MALQRPDRRRPISLHMMRQFWQLLPDVCLTPFEVTLFRAAFALAFYRAFRSSELLEASRNDVWGAALEYRDVIFAGAALHIYTTPSLTRVVGGWPYHYPQCQRAIPAR